MVLVDMVEFLVLTTTVTWVELEVGVDSVVSVMVLVDMVKLPVLTTVATGVQLEVGVDPMVLLLVELSV